eukprot:2342643-Prymnesium_polylepis.1
MTGHRDPAQHATTRTGLCRGHKSSQSEWCPSARTATGRNRKTRQSNSIRSSPYTTWNMVMQPGTGGSTRAGDVMLRRAIAPEHGARHSSAPVASRQCRPRAALRGRCEAR